MRGTIPDHALTIRDILVHGQTVHAGSRVVTLEEGRPRRASFAEVGERAARLAGALRRLGIGASDRVATFGWNTQEHLEAYLAVPSMGAVLHTLNIRLFPEQLVYVANHAEDRVIIVDDSVVPLLAAVRDELRTVEHVIVAGSGDASGLGETIRYDELLAAEAPEFDWPAVDERAAAAMCYTSGTTGNPKGVVYTHRSTYLHTLGTCTGSALGLSEHDRLLVIVPMFHANAWGHPYAGWLAGSDFVMPGRFLQAEPLCAAIAAERPTVSAAVPTIWSDILRYSETHPVDLSSLRLIVCGGSAVPRSLMERFQERHGVSIIQAWGMTETSPLAAVAFPPKGSDPADEMQWRAKTGRILGGVQMRIVDDAGTTLPWNGEVAGEIEVRGPWVTSSYYRDDDPEKFHDGWLRTGDVGTVDAKGFVQITDRAKDVIKSGGEWISSVELENEIMAHGDVVEAAVVGVPDARWEERPLACVVLAPEASRDVEALKTFLADRVAKWWIPERWTFITEVPKTSVGKFDKKVLRRRYADGELEVIGQPASRTA